MLCRFAHRCLVKAKTLIVLFAVLSLSSCSYVYEVKAEMVDGSVVFTSDKSWFRERCVRQIDVTAERNGPPRDFPRGEAEIRAAWSIRLANTCDNRFPIRYGQALAGPKAFANEGGVRVAPIPLMKDQVYTVFTVSGSTGHGSGRFVINANGTVTNLPPKD